MQPLNGLLDPFAAFKVSLQQKDDDSAMEVEERDSSSEEVESESSEGGGFEQLEIAEWELSSTLRDSDGWKKLDLRDLVSFYLSLIQHPVDKAPKPEYLEQVLQTILSKIHSYRMQGLRRKIYSVSDKDIKNQKFNIQVQFANSPVVHTVSGLIFYNQFVKLINLSPAEFLPYLVNQEPAKVLIFPVPQEIPLSVLEKSFDRMNDIQDNPEIDIDDDLNFCRFYYYAKYDVPCWKINRWALIENSVNKFSLEQLLIILPLIVHKDKRKVILKIISRDFLEYNEDSRTLKISLPKAEGYLKLLLNIDCLKLVVTHTTTGTKRGLEEESEEPAAKRRKKLDGSSQAAKVVEESSRQKKRGLEEAGEPAAKRKKGLDGSSQAAEVVEGVSPENIVPCSDPFSDYLASITTEVELNFSDWQESIPDSFIDAIVKNEKIHSLLLPNDLRLSIDQLNKLVLSGKKIKCSLSISEWNSSKHERIQTLLSPHRTAPFEIALIGQDGPLLVRALELFVPPCCFCLDLSQIQKLSQETVDTMGRLCSNQEEEHSPHIQKLILPAKVKDVTNLEPLLLISDLEISSNINSTHKLKPAYCNALVRVVNAHSHAPFSQAIPWIIKSLAFEAISGADLDEVIKFIKNLPEITLEIAQIITFIQRASPYNQDVFLIEKLFYATLIPKDLTMLLVVVKELLTLMANNQDKIASLPELFRILLTLCAEPKVTFEINRRSLTDPAIIESASSEVIMQELLIRFFETGHPQEDDFFLIEGFVFNRCYQQQEDPSQEILFLNYLKWIKQKKHETPKAKIQDLFQSPQSQLRLLTSKTRLYLLEQLLREIFPVAALLPDQIWGIISPFLDLGDDPIIEEYETSSILAATLVNYIPPPTAYWLKTRQLCSAQGYERDVLISESLTETEELLRVVGGCQKSSLHHLMFILKCCQKANANIEIGINYPSLPFIQNQAVLEVLSRLEKSENNDQNLEEVLSLILQLPLDEDQQNRCYHCLKMRIGLKQIPWNSSNQLLLSHLLRHCIENEDFRKANPVFVEEMLVAVSFFPNINDFYESWHSLFELAPIKKPCIVSGQLFRFHPRLYCDFLKLATQEWPIGNEYDSLFEQTPLYFFSSSENIKLYADYLEKRLKHNDASIIIGESVLVNHLLLDCIDEQNKDEKIRWPRLAVATIITLLKTNLQDGNQQYKEFVIELKLVRITERLLNANITIPFETICKENEYYIFKTISLLARSQTSPAALEASATLINLMLSIIPITSQTPDIFNVKQLEKDTVTVVCRYASIWCPTVNQSQSFEDSLPALQNLLKLRDLTTLILSVAASRSFINNCPKFSILLVNKLMSEPQEDESVQIACSAIFSQFYLSRRRPKSDSIYPNLGSIDPNNRVFIRELFNSLQSLTLREIITPEYLFLDYQSIITHVVAIPSLFLSFKEEIIRRCLPEDLDEGTDDYFFFAANTLSFLSDQEFELALERYKERDSESLKKSIERVRNFYYENKFSISPSYLSAPIPLVRTKPDFTETTTGKLSMLITFFDLINWQDKTKPHYIDPKRLIQDTKSKITQEKLKHVPTFYRKKLTQLIKALTDNLPFKGAPDSVEARDQLYQPLREKLQRIRSLYQFLLSTKPNFPLVYVMRLSRISSIDQCATILDEALKNLIVSKLLFLLKYYDAIEWQDTSSANYVDPSLLTPKKIDEEPFDVRGAINYLKISVEESTNPSPQKMYRWVLRRLLNKLSNNEPYTGAPEDPDERKKKYSKIIGILERIVEIYSEDRPLFLPVVDVERRPKTDLEPIVRLCQLQCATEWETALDAIYASLTSAEADELNIETVLESASIEEAFGYLYYELRCKTIDGIMNKFPFFSDHHVRKLFLAQISPGLGLDSHPHVREKDDYKGPVNEASSTYKTLTIKRYKQKVLTPTKIIDFILGNMTLSEKVRRWLMREEQQDLKPERFLDEDGSPTRPLVIEFCKRHGVF